MRKEPIEIPKKVTTVQPEGRRMRGRLMKRWHVVMLNLVVRGIRRWLPWTARDGRSY